VPHTEGVRIGATGGHILCKRTVGADFCPLPGGQVAPIDMNVGCSPQNLAEIDAADAMKRPHRVQTFCWC